jgi:hypothetical protein
MATIPADTKRGFYVVIGILVALYVGNLVLKRLPG